MSTSHFTQLVCCVFTNSHVVSCKLVLLYIQRAICWCLQCQRIVEFLNLTLLLWVVQFVVTCGRLSRWLDASNSVHLVLPLFFVSLSMTADSCHFSQLKSRSPRRVYEILYSTRSERSWVNGLLATVADYDRLRARAYLGNHPTF